ncbi:hypothetical protein [Actinomadura xylanilytica]|uniref:hypothetical protein n=1 Tax=Actinomadura xylanilytica TaxID=887459 RepID=UPI00255ABFF7|nr:hypothetical protein [Actinomadura xylanilytica]MDL4775762.1 hypothetical protein [Actinomadura xylanilytica]
MSQDRRLALFRQFLTDTQIPLRTRVAACLVLLYAQPVSRLVRLAVHDVVQDDGQVSVRLGDPPTPVPELFAAMLVDLTANRANMNTATNPDSDWLFPGGRAGQPLSPGALLQQLRALGVPITQTRTAAFRQLVLQAPRPSSPKPSASTTAPPPSTSPPAAEPGTTTRPPAPHAD